MAPEISLRSKCAHLLGVAFLLTALLCTFTSCASSEPWTFALSRAVYEDPIYPMSEPPQLPGEVAALILILPLAVDLVFFPVALTRDLIVMD